MRKLIAVAAFMLAGPAMAADKEEFHVKNASAWWSSAAFPPIIRTMSMAGSFATDTW